MGFRLMDHFSVNCFSDIEGTKLTAWTHTFRFFVKDVGDYGYQTYWFGVRISYEEGAKHPVVIDWFRES